MFWGLGEFNPFSVQSKILYYEFQQNENYLLDLIILVPWMGGATKNENIGFVDDIGIRKWFW